MRNVVLETWTPMHAHAHMHLPSSHRRLGVRVVKMDGSLRGPGTGKMQQTSGLKYLLTLCQPVSSRSGAKRVGSGVQGAAIKSHIPQLSIPADAACVGRRTPDVETLARLRDKRGHRLRRDRRANQATRRFVPCLGFYSTVLAVRGECCTVSVLYCTYSYATEFALYS